VSGDIGPTEPAYEINFEWKPIIDGDQAYVNEYIGGIFERRYGPMKPETVEPFIIDCKRIVTETFARIYGRA
jgi:hypothetical protein